MRGLAARLVPVCLLASAWILAHRYYGIRHDGVLYAAQGLLRLQPEVFGKDLFFATGSQDDYSVFGALYGQIVALLGLPVASLVTVAICQLLWFVAAFILLKTLLPARDWLVAAAVVLCLPGDYGVGGVLFRSAETFATARLPAEALGVLALGLALGGRVAVPLALVGLAFLLHPLMAVASACVLGMLLAARRWPALVPGLTRFALWAGLLLPVIAFVLPGLFPRIDDTWYALLRHRAPLVTPDYWTPSEWANVISPLILLDAVRRLEANERLRVFWLGAAVAAWLSLALSLAAALSHWTLLIQAQPWRIGWLTTFLAGAGLVRAFVNIRFSQPVVGHLLLAAVLGQVLGKDLANGYAGLMALGVAVLLWCSLNRRAPSGPVVTRLAIGVFIVCVGATVVQCGLKAYVSMRVVREDGAALPGTALAASDQFMWLLVPVAIALLQRLWRLSRVQIAPQLAFALPLLAFAVTTFDSTPPRARQMEHLMVAGLPAWEARIPKAAVVYWQGREGVGYCWFVLKRACYLTGSQSAGIVFSRATAIEAYRRLEHTEGVGLPKRFFDVHRGKRKRKEEAPASLQGLARLCSDPIVDFAVLLEPLDGGYLSRLDDLPTDKVHYLFDCRDRRSRAPNQPGSPQ